MKQSDLEQLMMLASQYEPYSGLRFKKSFSEYEYPKKVFTKPWLEITLSKKQRRGKNPNECEKLQKEIYDRIKKCEKTT